MDMEKFNQIKNDLKKKPNKESFTLLCYCYTCKTTVINVQIIA